MRPPGESRRTAGLDKANRTKQAAPPLYT